MIDRGNLMMNVSRQKDREEVFKGLVSVGAGSNPC